MRTFVPFFHPQTFHASVSHSVAVSGLNAWALASRTVGTAAAEGLKRKVSAAQPRGKKARERKMGCEAWASSSVRMPSVWATRKGGTQLRMLRPMVVA